MNVLDRYPVDRRRACLRRRLLPAARNTAQELALGYPDLFRGALLIAGSDAIGEAHRPPPSRDLFGQFQAGTRIVYLTGASDPERLAMDRRQPALDARAWCQFKDIAAFNPLGLGHETPSGADFALALRSLETPKPPDPAKLAGCQAGVERQLTARLGEIDALIAAGRLAEARRKLEAVDRHFGGLASPRSSEMAARLKVLGRREASMTCQGRGVGH